MKYKLISFIAIFFSIFCLSRSALASCSTDTDSGFSVCTDSYSDNGTWKTRKYVDVSSFEISVGPDSDWEINSDVSSKKALLKTLIQTKQKLPPPAAFTQSEFPIYVNGDAEYMINCQSNIGGIPCNDPKIRLVMKITISIQGNYVMEDITTDDGTKLPVGGGYYLYGFKKFGDAVEIVRLTPVSKPSSIKYTFTSYTALTSEFSCLFETIPVGNSVTSISFPNEKATITILKNDPSLSINCLFALPEGETVSASQDLTLFWNTFETGNYVDSLQEDSTHLYVVNFLTETTKHVTFHNNVQFTIFKDDLPYGISAIFTTLPSATTSPGGYAVGLDPIPYSTVLKFTLKGIICPDETTKKVNGVCPDSTCPANTPKWDLAKDKCVADCTENSNVTTTTGYGPDPDHDDTCKCSDTNFPNLDTTNKWCFPKCTGGWIDSEIKDGAVVCKCAEGWILDGTNCQEPKQPDTCTSDSQCIGYGHKCVDGECTLSITCETEAQCLGGKTCKDHSCVFKGQNDDCTFDSQCNTGLECLHWKCQAPGSSCTSDSECSSGQVCQSGSCVTASPGTNSCTGLGQTKGPDGHCDCQSGWACTKDTYQNCSCTQYDNPNGCKTGEVKNPSGSCICDETNGYFLDNTTSLCIYISNSKKPPLGCSLIGTQASSVGLFGFIFPLIAIVTIRMRRRFHF